MRDRKNTAEKSAPALVLNLMHDVVTSQRTVQQAREYCAEEFLRYRRREPTPYDPLHGKGHFTTARALLAQADLENARQQGEQNANGTRQ